MPTISGLWTQSEKDAFSYARRAYEEGLTATEGLRQYRDGGGHIANQSWYLLYRNANAISDWSDIVVGLPRDYVVREEMFTETDWDFREKYVVQMKVSGYSEELDQRISKWITVESDHIMTRSEWEHAAQLAVSDTIGSPMFTIDRFRSFEPLMRIR